MSKKISRCDHHHLVAQSFFLIKEQKKLLILPILSSCIVVLIIGFVFRLVINHEKFLSLKDHLESSKMIWFYLVIIFSLFAINQISLYFHAALTYCSYQHYQQKKPSLFAGLEAANKSYFKLLLWHLYGSALGIIFIIFHNQVQKNTYYRNKINGMRWEVASYFSVPIIILESVGPIKALLRSSDIIKEAWGTKLKSNFGFIPFLLSARITSLFSVLIGLCIGKKLSILIGLVIASILMRIISIINTTASTILSCALYFYTSSGKVPKGFEESLIKLAFIAFKK